MPIVIIVNPVAGGARRGQARRRVEIAASWRHPDGSRPEVVVTERPGHARDLALAAARSASLVVAWGGDGTINEVATALAFGNVPLGIVPAGSGNGLATELRIPTEPRTAIDRAVHAVPRRMDLGEIDGHLFVNIAGIGFDAAVAAEFNQPGNVKRGFATYAAITGRMLLRYRPADYRITTAATSIDAGRALLVAFANSAQFGNGARIAPAAAIDDGQLDLVVVQERSRLRTMIGVPKLFAGTANTFPGYRSERIAGATVRADRPIVFHADGEPIQGGRELVVKVHPAALPIAT